MVTKIINYDELIEDIKYLVKEYIKVKPFTEVYELLDKYNAKNVMDVKIKDLIDLVTDLTNGLGFESTSKPNDPVNHPRHYTEHPSGVECIQVTEYFNFCIGNAIKYLWRAGIKTDRPKEDLQKAVWYINRELQRLSDEK